MSERLYTVRLHHKTSRESLLIDRVVARDDLRAVEVSLQRLVRMGIDPDTFTAQDVLADPLITDLELA